MMDPRTHRTILTIALACLACLCGCNVVAPIALAFEPPPSKDAATKLDKSRTHVFFVDDRASLMPKRSLRAVIGQTAEQRLIREEILKPDMVVPSAQAMRVVEYESGDSPLSIADIGRKVGAEVVVYMTIDRWSLTRDGSSPAPTAHGRIKIIDALENERLFPGQDTGHPVTVRLPTRPGQVPDDRVERGRLERELAVALGIELAKVFFKHEIDPMTNRRL